MVRSLDHQVTDDHQLETFAGQSLADGSWLQLDAFRRFPAQKLQV